MSIFEGRKCRVGIFNRSRIWRKRCQLSSFICHVFLAIAEKEPVDNAGNYFLDVPKYIRACTILIIFNSLQSLSFYYFKYMYSQLFLLQYMYIYIYRFSLKFIFSLKQQINYILISNMRKKIEPNLLKYKYEYKGFQTSLTTLI